MGGKSGKSKGSAEAQVSAVDLAKNPKLKETPEDPDYQHKIRTANGTLIVKPVEDWDKIPPRKEGHLRFVCISDTHSMHDHMAPLPEGDVLIHAGDFSNIGEPKDIVSFNDFLGKQDFKHKIVIAGNHDLTFDPNSYEHTWNKFTRQQGVKHNVPETKAILKNCTYLEDQEVTINGIRIYGTPWQPEFCDWAFNLKRGAECQEKWDKIPSNLDILVSHGPPLGHGDLCFGGNNRAGCVNLLDEVEKRIKPKYHIFGHIHEGFGVTTNGVTKFINASTCNIAYDKKNLHTPIVFDYPIPKKQQEEEDLSSESE